MNTTHNALIDGVGGFTCTPLTMHSRRASQEATARAEKLYAGDTLERNPIIRRSLSFA